MDYKLAKELKDAGFPQTGRGATHVDCICDWYPIVYVPTLSELIEACGEGFQRLDKQKLVMSKNNYWAYSSKLDNAHTDRIGTKGKTPEESVAKLWLALNKVDTNKNT